MWRSWPFTRRIAVALVVAWVVALAILITSLLTVLAVYPGNEQMNRALALQGLEVDRLRRALSGKVASAKGFALTREPLFGEQMQAEREGFLRAAERLRPLVRDTPGAALLEQVIRAERQHEAAVQRLLWEEPGRSGRQQMEALWEARLAPEREQVEEALERLVRHSDERLVRHLEQELREDRQTLECVFTETALGLLAMLTLAWVLIRKLRPLQREVQDSEQRLRLLVEGVRDHALFLLDAQGRVAGWSPGAERIQGWTAEEVLGRPGALFYTPEQVAAGEPGRELARAERDGRLHTEGWRVRKNGTRFQAEVTTTALREEDGQLRGFTVVLRDVTERRRTERTLRLFAEAGRIFNQLQEPGVTVAELARLMVPEMADGCVLFMLEPGQWLRPRAVVHASPEKQRMLEALIQQQPPRPEAPLGVSWTVRTGRSQRLEQVTDAQLEQVARDQEHLRLLRRLELASSLSVPLKVGEQTLGALLLLVHRPERRFTQADQVFVEELAGRAALALDNARLFQESQRALELIGVASHDLGHPLNALKLQLERLRRLEPSREPQRVHEGLAAALRQAQRLGQLLHNLLDLSRLSSGKLALDASRMELTELVREVVERHSEQAAEAGCSLLLAAGGRLEGWWDRLRLERVVTNLLANALKFGRGKPVEIRLEQVEGRARLTVRDHGVGIAREAQQRIFERFEREKTGGRHAGFGLGLYIVRQLVEAHGGTIQVESEPGQGAAFTVELPMTPPPEPLSQQ